MQHLSIESSYDDKFQKGQNRPKTIWLDGHFSASRKKPNLPNLVEKGQVRSQYMSAPCKHARLPGKMAGHFCNLIML